MKYVVILLIGVGIGVWVAPPIYSFAEQVETARAHR